MAADAGYLAQLELRLSKFDLIELVLWKVFLFAARLVLIHWRLSGRWRLGPRFALELV